MELQNNIASAQHMVDQIETERQPGLTVRGRNVLVLIITEGHKHYTVESLFLYDDIYPR